MDKRFENYTFPFMWIRNGETDQLITHIDIIQKSGCNALCVESRTHEHFCEAEWWTDFALILSECKKRGMDVWLLDDKNFPTGYASGAVEKNPLLGQRVLIEKHVDVIGPVKGHYAYLKHKSNEQLLGVYAYRRCATDDTVSGEAIDLSGGIDGDRVYFDLPDGAWRIAYYITTCDFTKPHYINMVDSRSAKLMIKAVYEPHYQHFKEYFGNTFKGFFSDEPCFGNEYYEEMKALGNIYEKRIGRDGLALPFSEQLWTRLCESYGHMASADLYGLWHPYEDKSASIRLAYMNTATKLYAENFSDKLGTWCRAHGVAYIGHVDEDNGAHTRLGTGAGHYFRAIRGQDMAGIDVVLHQILPGFAHTDNTVSFGDSVVNSAFFHYGLTKLASSAAHTTPHMKNRALCEIFGAYGWGAGIPMMKWLTDFMLVRGINRFVPHAFSLKYPDPDCPPHFGAKAYPQQDGFRKLMSYMSRMCELLSDGKHVADAAILYHAELEWANFDCMPFHIPAKELYDHQLDYDVLDLDALENCHVQNGKIVLQEEYPCLIVPECKTLPPMVAEKLNAMADSGARILYVNSLPEGAQGSVVSLEKLPEHLGKGHLNIHSDCKMLRVYHVTKEGKELLFLFNESLSDTCHFSFATTENALRTDILHEESKILVPQNGRIHVSLRPYESVLFTLREAEAAESEISAHTHACQLPCTWNISLFDTVLGKRVADYTAVDAFFDLSGKSGVRDFCGHATFTTEFEWSTETENVMLEVFAPEQTVKCILNGIDLGLEICPPYVFHLGKALRQGKNSLCLTTSNTLANRHNEHLTTYYSIPPTGLTEVNILCRTKE